MSISMRDFHLAGFGDHLRVGPQYVLPADRGTPVVERGPHGQYLSTRNLKDPLQFWAAGRVAQPWTPRQRVTSIMGMGAGRAEAERSTKADLSKRAKALATTAQGTIDPDAITAQANALEVELNSYEPWSDYNFGLFGFGTIYDDSQTVRSNLQSARNNAQRARGNRPADWAPSPVFAPTDTAAEIRKELPGAIRERYTEIVHDEIPWGKIAVGLAVGVAAYGFGKTVAGRVF